jgi:hypothetical protein
MLRFVELSLSGSCVAVSSICVAPFSNLFNSGWYQFSEIVVALRLPISLVCPRPTRVLTEAIGGLNELFWLSRSLWDVGSGRPERQPCKLPQQIFMVFIEYTESRQAGINIAYFLVQAGDDQIRYSSDRGRQRVIIEWVIVDSLWHSLSQFELVVVVWRLE